MASAQIAGQYKIFLHKPDGTERLVASNNAYWFGPGGASESTPANTPEKWNYLPLSADVGGPGYSIVIKVNPGSAATVGGDDSFMSLPIVVNGNAQSIGADLSPAGLGNDNFAVDVSWNAQALIASQDNVVASYRAKENVYFRVGGNRVFLSCENNA